MQRIVPNIWCDGTADEAAEFYLAAFAHLPGTAHVRRDRYPTEGLLDFQEPLAGKTLTQELDLAGHRFILVNAGNEFAPTPAISFFVNADPSQMEDPRGTLDTLWAALTDGGRVLMDLGAYPHSPHYGWVEDRYGVSWQLMLTDAAGDPRPVIVPQLMFGGPAQNRAAEALDHYLRVFDDAAPGQRVTYGQLGGAPEGGPVTEDSIVFADVQLRGEWIAAMDSAVEQDFTFTEGLSLMVQCEDQDEIDRLWDALSAVPAAEQCGWLKDRWGVSWQIVPQQMGELMSRPGAFEKMLEMKKLVIADF
ncbi:MAG: VOC family protein [Micrococcus sp.]|nr:VOC family protein [Micrococcus sp.]